MKINKGISINNGDLTANNIATGKNVSIHSTNQSITTQTNDLKEIQALFEKLIAGIHTSALPSDEKEAVVSSLETAKQEFAKEKPNKLTASLILKGVLENLKYVKDLIPIGQLILDKVGS